MTKATSIRIEEDLKAEVDAVARADDVPASEVIRAALYRYIAERKTDPQFQSRIRELLQKDREVIERLAAGLAA
jgi:predicted transcriptional regulator